VYDFQSLPFHAHEPIQPQTIAKYPPPTPAEISVFVEDEHYVFRTGAGLALYTFAHDKEGQSICNGECAKTWPPLIASAEATRAPRTADGAWHLVES
jgi:predicted lipoprotein with Yx(FWY)xxD motif